MLNGAKPLTKLSAKTTKTVCLAALLGVLAVAVGGGATMLAISVSTRAAQAQSDNSNATPAQRKACTPDVYRLCAGEIPSVSKITSCLRRNKASLSDACRAVFEQ